MAESKENGNGAGAGAPGGAAPGAGAQPSQAPASLSILAQYVKDLSLENPAGVDWLRPRQTAPRTTINVDMQATQVAVANALPGASEGTDHEVELKLDTRIVDGDKTLLVVELSYVGVLRIANVPAEQVRPFLLIEGPRLLFPFARQVLADASRNAGLPVPILLNPIDFVALYRQRMAQAQAAASGAPQRLV